jgi:hypothetical protein
MAPNEAAIRKWIKDNRPDLPQHQIDGIMDNPGVFGMMSMAFEAGREFQIRNPEAEPGPLDLFQTWK